MKLNETQRALIVKARENLLAHFDDAGYQNEYICHQVYFADQGLFEMPAGKSFFEVVRDCSADAFALLDAVEIAINNHGTMEGFIWKCAGVDYQRTPYKGYAYLARLAWLEKMIETGEIA